MGILCGAKFWANCEFHFKKDISVETFSRTSLQDDKPHPHTKDTTTSVQAAAMDNRVCHSMYNYSLRVHRLCDHGTVHLLKTLLDEGRTTDHLDVSRTDTVHFNSLVPSLSVPQIFIAYSMKNRGGKSGRKHHGRVTHCLFNLVNVIDRLCHECQRVCKQRAKDMRTEALDK